MRMCVEIDGGAVEAGGLEFTGKGFNHPVNLRERHFQMKEQAIGIPSITESLVGGES